MNQTDPTAARPPMSRGAKAEALLLRFTAEAHRRKWSYDRGLDDDGVPIKSEAFDALHRLGDEMRAALDDLRQQPAAASAVVSPPTDRATLRERIVAAIKASPFEELRSTDYANGPLKITVMVDDLADTLLRRLAVEHGAGAQQQDDTEAHANGLPLVKGNCPGCRRASLFLGTGGYPTCSNWECPEPDAATTVLEQYANEAHEPEHSWAAELHDPLADEWVPGTRYLVRDRAVNALEHSRRIGPTWKDGTPVERRLVRATTTYTVEEPAAEQQAAAADDEETQGVTRQCDYADWHDGHPWADRPNTWCPGHDGP